MELTQQGEGRGIRYEPNASNPARLACLYIHVPGKSVKLPLLLVLLLPAPSCLAPGSRCRCCSSTGSSSSSSAAVCC